MFIVNWIIIYSIIKIKYQSRMIKKVMFIGSKYIGFKSLETIYQFSPDKLVGIVTIDDTKDLRSKLIEFKNFSKNNNIKLNIIAKPLELEKVIEENNPDLCIVVGWYWLINETLLQKVKEGFIGIHTSLLPNYRGGAPLVWAIINGETESGVTLFYFDKEMDSGNVIAQKKFNIENNESIKEVSSKAEKLSVELIKENYPLIINGTVNKKKQNSEKASYCSQRKPEDGRIDWKLTNKQIHNFIRAQTHPYPGAFSFLEDGRKVFILRSKEFPYDYYGPPGLIVQKLKEDVIVTCGVNALLIEEVKVEGENIEKAGNVLKYGTKLL